MRTIWKLSAIVIPDKSCSFLIVSWSKGLSPYFMCSDQHVKYQMLRGFPFTSSLLLDYHVKQRIHSCKHSLIFSCCSVAKIWKWLLESPKSLQCVDFISEFKEQWLYVLGTKVIFECLLILLIFVYKYCDVCCESYLLLLIVHTSALLLYVHMHYLL